MIFALRSEFRQGPHRPIEMAKVVAVAVAEPVRVAEPAAAARNFAVIAREVRRVIQRAEGVLAGLAVPCEFKVHGVDRSPARGVAPETRPRAATPAARGPLFVNAPCSEVGAAAESLSNPVDDVS